MDGVESDTICIGDDATDENMFAELKAGITVRVGSEDFSAAHYWIGETGILPFLRCVREAVEELRHRPN